MAEVSIHMPVGRSLLLDEVLGVLVCVLSFSPFVLLYVLPVNNIWYRVWLERPQQDRRSPTTCHGRR